jgi:peptidoglycan/xylan/chitin deacetylase (PgdA/CDA1 family)
MIEDFMTRLIVLYLFLFILPAFAAEDVTPVATDSRPTISFTFDDGSVKDMPGYTLERWNSMLLDNLKKHGVKAILFSTGSNKTSEEGTYVLSSWNDAGHRIANHTMTHPNFNKVSIEKFEWELVANDSLIRKYSNYLPLFRFPYLKEGNTEDKIRTFRSFMQEHGYRNGHVTIDASDWYVDGRLVQRLREDSTADLTGFKKFYIAHLFDRAMYYENLAHTLTGRHINHVILLHHNLAAALFLGELIQHFKDAGWNVIDADKAYNDPVYTTVTTVVPAGESLIWSMAKQSGRFEQQLRYPAEDGEYEKEKMDELGL